MDRRAHSIADSPFFDPANPAGIENYFDAYNYLNNGKFQMPTGASGSFMNHTNTSGGDPAAINNADENLFRFAAQNGYQPGSSGQTYTGPNPAAFNTNVDMSGLKPTYSTATRPDGSPLFTGQQGETATDIQGNLNPFWRGNQNPFFGAPSPMNHYGSFMV